MAPGPPIAPSMHHPYSQIFPMLKINERIEYKLLSLTVPAKLLPLLNSTYLYAQPDLCSTHVLLAPHLLSSSLDHPHLLP